MSDPRTLVILGRRAHVLNTRGMSSATRDVVTRSLARAGATLNPIERDRDAARFGRDGLPYMEFADRQTAVIRAWDATGDAESRKDARSRTWWALANGHRVPC